jgi:uncharacterized protein (DUF2141 family)
MKRYLLPLCLLSLLLTATAFAQAPGHLEVSVSAAQQASLAASPVAGAKIIVVHWTQSQLHSSMIQEALTTSDQMGTAAIDLPPGTYDVFVSSQGLAPAASRINVQSGTRTQLPVKLNAAPTQLRPTE